MPNFNHGKQKLKIKKMIFLCNLCCLFWIISSLREWNCKDYVHNVLGSTLELLEITGGKFFIQFCALGAKIINLNLIKWLINTNFMILTFCFAWLTIYVKMILEFFYWLDMKLYMDTKKLSAKLASETEIYIDFKPLTFGLFLKKTL